MRPIYSLDAGSREMKNGKIIDGQSLSKPPILKQGVHVRYSEYPLYFSVGEIWVGNNDVNCVKIIANMTGSDAYGLNLSGS